MRPVALALAASLSAAACQDYVFEQKAVSKVKETTVVKPGATPIPADILFIVDNSGSMADDQDNLARNFDAFINELVGAGDYQIGIVTTDLESTNNMNQAAEIGGRAEFGFSATPPNVLSSFNRDSCAPLNPRLEHGCFLGNAMNRVITSKMPKQTQIDAFKTNVRVGSCGSGNEQGLEAMKLALNQSIGTQGCNANFLRPGANLVVVIVTDEEDCRAENGQCVGNPPAVASYIEELKRLKGGSLSSVRLAAIVGAVNDPQTGWNASRCRIGGGANCGSTCMNMPPAGSHTPGCRARPATCNAQTEYCDTANDRCESRALQYWDYCYWCSYYNTADCCSAVPGSRYVNFLKQFERELAQVDNTITETGCRRQQGKRIGCLIDSICQENFNDTLAAIARDLVVTTDYVLDPPASYPQGVTVKVGGVPLVYGVDFDISADGTRLTIKGARTPKPGEDVEIYYSREE